jgi:putative nucleotidyltransferase with HDIG domain
MSGYVVLDRDGLPSAGPLTLVRLDGSRRVDVQLDEFSTITDLRQARDAITRSAQDDFADRPAHVRDAMVAIARSLTVPNLRFNASETEVRRDAAAAAVAEAKTTYLRGQVFLRSGEPVTPWVLHVLDEMHAGAAAYHPLQHHLAQTLLLFLMLTGVERFASRFMPSFRRRFSDLLAMSVLLVLVCSGSALLAGLARSLGDRAPVVPPEAWGYLVPVATGGILLRTILNAETAAAWGVLAALCAAVVGHGDLPLATYYVVSVLAATVGLGKAHERGRLIRAGFVGAIANAVVVLAMDLVAISLPGGAGADLRALLAHAAFALAGGIVSGVLAVGLAPLFEGLGFVTDSKLLELASLNHPLLREMIVKAPGTYHHSMMVGSLAEAAADAIGANSLLVRVGAYFHDIGKTRKPQYFIENQPSAENPHDRLTPSMSALVITSHVKEGIELGREFKLPHPIVDFIPQHHGTSLVSFFYNKALQTSDPDKGGPNEDDYRYPGPKPQSKEAAIMMLADAAEAATRSLKTHTQGAISARVEKIVNKFVGEGQLDESPLTLRDLRKVSETFVQVLMGIHHHRIEYPQPPDAARLRGRGLPASAITLELPPLTPNPDPSSVTIPRPSDSDGTRDETTRDDG